MKKLRIALLGSLPKGDKVREGFLDWKTEYVEKIQKAIPEALFLHGDLIKESEGSEVIVGHDLWLVKKADIVIVHASSKIGAGTAQEIVLAKKFKKPVISFLPKNTHHRKSNVVFHSQLIKDWIHPFLDLSSDVVVDTIDEAIKWIKSHQRNPKTIKDISIFTKAISTFEKKLPKSVKSYKSQGW